MAVAKPVYIVSDNFEIVAALLCHGTIVKLPLNLNKRDNDFLRATESIKDG
jgi:hypothetical protein